MNVQLLIDSIVRQVTVLVAHLATSGGARTPLADVAAQVFRDLAEELHRQGVSRKVAADMFGMALRTYRRKIQRFSESRTAPGRSLWEAVHAFITERSVVSRKELMRRFHRDEEATVRAVLQDLVESGLVYRAGKGQTASYRVATSDDLAALGDEERDPEGLDTLVWGAVYRGVRVTRSDLERLLPLPAKAIDDSLERLVGAERLERADSDDRTTYAASGFVIPVGSSFGWEAALFDHFQAVVGTMCTKTRADASSTAPNDAVGGSTYTLEIWPGHPLEEEVLSQLSRFRERVGALRRRVADHNRATALPDQRLRVVIYGGQNVLEVSGGSIDEPVGEP